MKPLSKSRHNFHDQAICLHWIKSNLRIRPVPNEYSRKKDAAQDPDNNLEAGVLPLEFLSQILSAQWKLACQLSL